jgi:hypothetical protein
VHHIVCFFCPGLPYNPTPTAELVSWIPLDKLLAAAAR